LGGWGGQNWGRLGPAGQGVGFVACNFPGTLPRCLGVFWMAQQVAEPRLTSGRLGRVRVGGGGAPEVL